MAFIGGGAKNYTEFLRFLGKKSPLLGSPFQINFPRPADRENQGMKAADPITRACNDIDPAYRCACVDCPASCPELPELTQQQSCHIGILPCLSFAAILIYGALILLLITVVFGHVCLRHHQKSRNERLQLLQDAAPSDDEDEGDVVNSAGMLDRPLANYRTNSICDAAFNRLGGICARFPLITITISVLTVVLLSLGWMSFEVEKNPVRLWVSPSSSAAQEKSFFDSSFGPFYRAEQAFLVNDTQNSGPGPVLSYDTLKWWFDVERRVAHLKTIETGTTLDDVCFQPTGDACVIQSLTGYFQGDINRLESTTWEQKVRKCTDAPGEDECRPLFELPLEKTMILGGWEETGDVVQSQALITTWVVTNHPQGSKEEGLAMEWEQSLRDLLLKVQREANDRGLRLSFNTEISLEEELNKTSNTDAKIVVISYIVMFLYASLALGSAGLSLKSLLDNPAAILVQSQFTLGVCGIIIVLMSVSASVGLFSVLGVKVTLIIAEVIPFLVLAVGVDNIFLIVHEFERVNVSHPDEEIDSRIAKALGRMGPSILLSASTETIAFALGVFVGMPAVRNFAVYAAGAVLINALLQVTMFVSVLALNQRRVQSSRIDCFPLIKIRKADIARLNCAAGYELEHEGPLQKFIREKYAPTLLNRKVKLGVVLTFLGFFAVGTSLLPSIALGLDQRLAIPDDSYLIPYFNDLYDYFDTGPPVYFVTRDVNVTKREHQQELCGRFTTCHTFSLANVLEQESKRSNVSHISGATANWLDDFFFWLSPDSTCCMEHGKICFEDRSPPWNVTMYGMPEGDEFVHYLSKWLAAPTDVGCSLGGKAPYSTAVVISKNQTTIPASHFRTSHTPLRSQEDFIAAYASARRIADDISSKQGISVFPYSKFYIFFDQYSSIIKLTGALLGSALGLILIITSILLGSAITGAVVTLTVIMIVTDILGTMAVVGVSLNALSLVNLIICVGIGVEFCAHIARAFMFPSRSIMEKAKTKFRGRDARAWTALVNVGGSVFSGITVTKLLGVSVLAFTRSKIFEVYYFRVWLALVGWAATHALIFLPVALSLVGGEGKLLPVK
jgi:Niemann-Pick C1 protein